MTQLPSFPSLDDRLRMALAEDVGPGDVTSEAIFRDESARAEIRCKAEGVLSGLKVAERVFQLLAQERSRSCRFEALHGDGDNLRPGEIVARLDGPAALMLAGERVALNLLQRLSGVASLTRRCVEAAGGLRIVDTRKTTPLWRDLEKEAVRHGGGSNHRMGLYDAYMIKDNHIDAAGSLSEAFRRVLEHNDEAREITVEVRNLDELDEALRVAPPDTYIMLDNMADRDELEAALLRIGDRAQTEVSGGLRVDTLARVAALPIDRVSIGSLTHSAPALDFSMKIVVH